MVEINKEKLDSLESDIRVSKMQHQENFDTIDGQLTSRNMASFRNTVAFCAQDSLDSVKPMYVHFNIMDETVKIVSVKLSFWIQEFRAYESATVNAAEATSSTQAEATSSSVGTPSGGGETGTTDTNHILSGNIVGTYTAHSSPTGLLPTQLISGDFNTSTHHHSIAAHTHSAHTHTVAAHSHTVAAHNHAITYGIYEANTEPTIAFSVSEDGGVAYKDAHNGFVTDQLAFDITADITKTGHKIIKFTTDLLARLSVQVECKMDIRVR